jgi:DNA-directed RNA polymerase I subunit RPA1
LFNHEIYLHFYRLRLSSIKVRHALIKLKLLELGNVREYNSFDDIVTLPTVFEDIDDEHASNLEEKLNVYERQYLQYITMNDQISKNNLLNPNNKKRIKQNDVVIKTIQRSVIDKFLKDSVNIKKCENCGTFSNSFRKDGYSKIFQKPLPKRDANQNKAMKKKIKVHS